MATLDRGYYERELYRELHNLRPEIMRQMALTVALTDEFKGTRSVFPGSYAFVEGNPQRSTCRCHFSDQILRSLFWIVLDFLISHSNVKLIYLVLTSAMFDLNPC